ncbi:hypothetical protein WJX81_004447 [Elliptochloris bilobata]|uniref:Phosphatidic acid phosphatase type 2/haloperoxidase domain-containing protein n=1 Tax=Elliptochloris bilobata TaxID=381761 RepID=A0AAW1QZ58_9CHLO
MAVHAVASPGVALGATVLFLLTAFDVFGGAPFGLGVDSLHLLPRFVDGPVHAWVRSYLPAEVRWGVAEKLISDAAIVSGLAGWATCGGAVLMQSPQRGLPRVGAALAALLALGGDAVTCHGDVLGVEQLKQLFHRARPSDLHHTYAFPSGHTTAATFIVGALLFVALPLCAPALTDSNPSVDPTANPGRQAATVGRVLGGVHWVSDTLAGACLGTALVSGAETAVGRSLSGADADEVDQRADAARLLVLTPHQAGEQRPGGDGRATRSMCAVPVPLPEEVSARLLPADMGAEASGGEGEDGAAAERVLTSRCAGPSGRGSGKRRARLQEGEELGGEPFVVGGAEVKPMMEMVAGSNRWYQATVVRQSAHEVEVSFPPTKKGVGPTEEWVDRRSSRWWRGALDNSVWKYLGKGAWAPRKRAKPCGRARAAGPTRTKARVLGPRRGAAHPADETTGGTGTATGASMELDSGDVSPAAHLARPCMAPDLGSVGGVTGSGGSSGRVGSGRGATNSNTGIVDVVGGGGSTKSPANGTTDTLEESEPERDPLAEWFLLHFGRLDARGLFGKAAVGEPQPRQRVSAREMHNLLQAQCSWQGAAAPERAGSNAEEYCSDGQVCMTAAVT